MEKFQDFNIILCQSRKSVLTKTMHNASFKFNWCMSVFCITVHQVHLSTQILPLFILEKF